MLKFFKIFVVVIVALLVSLFLAKDFLIKNAIIDIAKDSLGAKICSD